MRRTSSGTFLACRRTQFWISATGPNPSGLRQDRRGVRAASANLDVVHDYTETRYGAESWHHPRRVVARIEAPRKGLDTRYVATNITAGNAEWLYDSLCCA